MPDTRTCLGCKEIKPIEEFRWRSKEKGTRAPRCGPCDQAYRKRYYDEGGGKAKITSVSARCREQRVARIAAGDIPPDVFEHRACLGCGVTQHPENFRVLSSRLMLRHPRCHSCDPWYRAVKYKETKYLFQASKARRLKQLRDLVDSCKTGKLCLDCGLDYPTYVMDFDHRDPSTKVNKVSAMVYNASEEDILTEIEKCDLICANCHRVRTHKRKYEEYEKKREETNRLRREQNAKKKATGSATSSSV